MKRFIGRSIAVMCLLIVVSMCDMAQAQIGENRVWWSHDGSDSMEASLVSFDKKSRVVSLKGEDNEIVEVKITLLSSADRRYVARTVRKQKKTEKKAEQVSEQPIEVQKVERKKKNWKSTKRFGIDWTRGFDAALAHASDEGNRKPVMLFRVLGDLTGLM